MYQDYLNAIIDYYQTGKKNARIPQRLIRPTPGSIKDECVSVCETRFDKKDLGTLQAFFKVENNQDGMLRAISRCDRDRFRPLANFLEGRTSATDDLNIELLAWLINFSNCPYKAEDWSGDFGGIQAEKNIEESFTVFRGDTRAITTTGKELARDEKTRGWIEGTLTFFNSRRKIAFVLIGILLLASLGFYLVKDREASSGILDNGRQQCMMWVGDHYVQTSCDKKHGDTLVIALDTQRVNHFQRVTRPDTITLASEGKLWYIKRNGHIEYYTAGGKHPVDQNRVLRPLSRYMILKYQNSPQ
jgi:hypothetical protein